MKFLRFTLVFLLFILLGACTPKNKLINVDYIKIDNLENSFKTYQGIVKSANSTILSFQSEGQIVFLPYSKGDFVKKGEVIARLDGTLYSIKKNEEMAKLQEYVIQEAKQKRYYERLDILHKEGAISDNDWENAFYELKSITAQIKVQKEKINYIDKEITYNIITAPYNGYIGEKFADIGTNVKNSTPIISFISDTATQVEIMVGENDINKIKLKDEVLIEILNKNYKGQIVHISKSSLDSGGYLIKILIINPSGFLNEGMSAKVKITSNKTNSTLLPLECIYQENDKNFIYEIVNIKDNIGEIKKKNVLVGKIIDNKAEILNGIKADDIIILNHIDAIKHKKVKL